MGRAAAFGGVRTRLPVPGAGPRASWHADRHVHRQSRPATRQATSPNPRQTSRFAMRDGSRGLDRRGPATPDGGQDRRVGVCRDDRAGCDLDAVGRRRGSGGAIVALRRPCFPNRGRDRTHPLLLAGTCARPHRQDPRWRAAGCCSSATSTRSSRTRAIAAPRAGDKLIGSGTIDMKGGVALSLGVLRALAEVTDSFGEVALLLVNDEEFRTSPFAHGPQFSDYDACLCFEGGERTRRRRRASSSSARRRLRSGSMPTASPPTPAPTPTAAAARCSPSRRSPRGSRRCTIPPARGR